MHAQVTSPPPPPPSPPPPLPPPPPPRPQRVRSARTDVKRPCGRHLHLYRRRHHRRHATMSRGAIDLTPLPLARARAARGANATPIRHRGHGQTLDALLGRALVPCSCSREARRRVRSTSAPRPQRTMPCDGNRRRATAHATAAAARPPNDRATASGVAGQTAPPVASALERPGRARTRAVIDSTLPLYEMPATGPPPPFQPMAGAAWAPPARARRAAAVCLTRLGLALGLRQLGQRDLIVAAVVRHDGALSVRLPRLQTL